MCDTVVSFTSDLGVEKDIGDIPAALNAVFQGRVVGYDDDGDDFAVAPDFFGQEHESAEAASDHYLMKHSLSIPGALHILHSVVKYMSDAMPSFKIFFWEPFKALVDFLRRRACRRFLVHHCFSKPPADHLQFLFRSFTASLKDRSVLVLVSLCPLVEWLGARLVWCRV